VHWDGCRGNLEEHDGKHGPGASHPGPGDALQFNLCDMLAACPTAVQFIVSLVVGFNLSCYSWYDSTANSAQCNRWLAKAVQS